MADETRKIEQAFRDTAADLLVGLRKDKEETLKKMDDLKDEDKEKRMQTIVDSIDSMANGVMDSINSLIGVVNGKKDREDVSINNINAITDVLEPALKEISDTVRKELGKIDKEVVIKNDLSQLTALFKSSGDKKDIIGALKKVETAIRDIDVDVVIPKQDIKFDTKKIEVLLDDIRKKEFFLPPVVSVDLDPNLVEDDRVRVTLPDSQVQKMSASFASATNGANKSVRITSKDGNDVGVTPNEDRNTDLDGENGLNTNAMMFGRVNDDTVKNARLDASTETLIAVDYEHHELHDGTHYFCRGFIDTSAANNEFLVVTDNSTKWAHAVWEFQSEGEFNFELFEDTVTSDDGTALDCYNNNRNSSNTNLLTPYSAPTVTTDGTLLWAGKLGSGKQVGGENRNGSELILKQNTKYLFRFTKVAAGTLWLDYDFKWYEHTDRN